MGYSSYDSSSRLSRSKSLGYQTKSVDEIFTQQKLRMTHELMNPTGLTYRECRDSNEHPNTKPYIISLDVTGSMGKVPHDLVKTGLPTIMSKITENGVPDASVLFTAVGDHVCDNYPLQVAQFESGDEELDNWITKTYIEGRGGGNAGESYLLSWYVAAFHTKTDAFEKRNEKGILFTIGDEECLRSLTNRDIRKIFGRDDNKSFTDYELLEEAQKMYDVYHLHVLHGPKSEDSLGYWKEMLGNNCIEVSNYQEIPDIIANKIIERDGKNVLSAE